ncbi:MAG: hypothetical protein JKY56_12980, partial [Kofleriaceae bacterium]|nr:hypothetical protein [Kofleriaceae bacterium]
DGIGNEASDASVRIWDAGSIWDGANTSDANMPEVDAGTETFSALTHIDYTGPSDTASADFSTCFFCDASDAVSHLLLRYQQGDGFTIWAVYIPKNVTSGTHALTPDFSGNYATLSANDSSLFATARGFYGGDIGSGTITFTRAELESGGVVEGTIDVRFTKAGTTAHLTSTFRATIP